MDKIIDEIKTERISQQAKYSSKHDDGHSYGDLEKAAACYILTEGSLKALDKEVLDFTPVPFLWPWSEDDYKPRNQRDDLVRGAALTVAAIQRLDRMLEGSRSAFKGFVKRIGNVVFALSKKTVSPDVRILLPTFSYAPLPERDVGYHVIGISWWKWSAHMYVSYLHVPPSSPEQDRKTHKRKKYFRL